MHIQCMLKQYYPVLRSFGVKSTCKFDEPFLTPGHILYSESVPLDSTILEASTRRQITDNSQASEQKLLISVSVLAML